MRDNQPQTTDPYDHVIAQLARAHRQWLDAAPPQSPLRPLWQGGMDVLRQQGLPTKLDEHWRYLQLDLSDRRLAPPTLSPAAILSDLELSEHALHLVFIDGKLDRSRSTVVELSRQPGVRVEWLQEDQAHVSADLKARNRQPSMEGDQRYAAMNQAFLTHGFWLKLANATRLSKPLHIHHIDSGAGDAALYPRWLIDLGMHAELNLIEHRHSSRSRRSVNHIPLLHAQLGHHARLQHYRWQDLAANSLDLSQVQVHLGDHAHYQLLDIATGSGLVRTTLDVRLDGREATSDTRSISLQSASGQYNLSACIRHLQADTHSLQSGRFVATERARAIFDSQAIMAANVPGSSAAQSGRGLLDSRAAEIILRPQLELNHNDIRCRHGASVGHIDSAALRYLTQRGIAPAVARRMLLAAFIADMLPAALPQGWAEAIDAALEQLTHLRAGYAS